MSNPSLKNRIQVVLDTIPIDFGGGCSIEKALVMGSLIEKYELQKTLDIGVYRGRSLFPQAIAHAQYSKGKVYGVDPYRNEEARQFDNPALTQALEDFARVTDFEALYQDVLTLRQQHGLQNHCELVRKRSDEAAKGFGQAGVRFDLIHIDGNHDTKAVMSDVELYLPLLSRNGFIVLDDISWTSVKPAMAKLDGLLNKVFELTGIGNDFAVYWNGTSWYRNYRIKKFLKEVVG